MLFGHSASPDVASFAAMALALWALSRARTQGWLAGALLGLASGALALSSSVVGAGLVWLVALLVLLGVADSCRVQEDPHRTLVQGSLQELNDSWTLETDRQAVYDIPESMGESLMLSIRSTKQKLSKRSSRRDSPMTGWPSIQTHTPSILEPGR